MAVNLPQAATNAGYPLNTGQPFLVSGSGAYLVWDGSRQKWENLPVANQATYKTYVAKVGPRGSGGEVRMDNYKIALNGVGNASLVIGTVSGGATINFSTQAITTQVFGNGEENKSISTNYTYFVPGYSLTSAGNMQEAVWMDTTNALYRATLLIGNGYANNIISVEKLSN